MNSQARKPTNLSLDANLLTEAKAQQWRARHSAAVRSSNEYVETHGLPLDRYRQF